MDISDYEREMSAFLEQGQIRITPSIMPHWLLNDFHDTVWRLKTNQSRQIKGQWKGTLNIHCDRPVAGTDKRLTDPEYSLLLTHLKLAIIAMRESPAADIGIEQVYQAALCWLRLADWLVLHRAEQVKSFGLNALDCDAVEKFLLDVYEYGAGAADWIVILENHLIGRFQDASERARVVDWEVRQSRQLLDRLDCPADAEHDDRLPEWLGWTRRWLHMQGWIKPDGRLDMKHISDILRIDCGRLSNSASFIYYLRQFEDTLDYARYEGYGFREKMGHKHRTVQDVALSPVSGNHMRGLFGAFPLLARCVQYCEGMEDHFTLTVEQLQDGIPTYLKGNNDKRTRSMSVDTALHIYKRAIHWALHYSKPLTTYYAQLIQHVQANQGNLKQLAPKDRQRVKDNWWEDAFKAIPAPQELAPLNIVQFYGVTPASGMNGYLPDGSHPLPALLRQRMGVEDAMRLNDAVQLLLTSAFTARRHSELCLLLRDCLSFIPGRGAFIDFGLAKATKESIRLVQQRPIPTMLFEVLRAQAAFADTLTAAYQPNDPHLQELLFVYPSSNNNGIISSENELYERLDLFCDFIEVPLDENGRRWYIRTHEARRFFALAFFWLFEGASLAALSWFLGHRDIQETWRYIKSEMTGEEISEVDAMIALKAMRSGADYSGVDKLREIVYRHFGIDSLELIKLEELEAYLEDLSQEGVFSVQAYLIEDEVGIQTHSVENGTVKGNELVIEVYQEDAA